MATVVTRLRLDAQLFAPALEQCATNPATPWTSFTVAQWYGRAERLVDVSSQTAVWYHTGVPPVPIRWVLIRDPAGEFATQALLCTDLDASPAQILAWFVQRWQLEVTFHEMRAQLGMETQRQWTALAIARTTPALFGLFSLVTLVAHPWFCGAPPLRQSAWYHKPLPTFADALALVRRRLWMSLLFPISSRSQVREQIPRAVLDHLCDLLCYAA